MKPQIDTVKPRWFYFNSACRPFGMVNLSPDTQTKGDWDAGYRYKDDTIECFSHIHGWQLTGLAVMPVTRYALIRRRGQERLVPFWPIVSRER